MNPNKEFEQNIEAIRKEFAEKLNVSEEYVANAINEVVMLDKRYLLNVAGIKSQADGLKASLMALNLDVLNLNLSDKSKFAYIRMSLLRAIKPIIASSVDKERIDLFIGQLERELKTNWSER